MSVGKLACTSVGLGTPFGQVRHSSHLPPNPASSTRVCAPIVHETSLLFLNSTGQTAQLNSRHDENSPPQMRRVCTCPRQYETPPQKVAMSQTNNLCMKPLFDSADFVPASIDTNRFDGLVLCKCKGRYYCNKACRQADKNLHGPECKTIEYLAEPGDMAIAPTMIKPRDKGSAEIARQEDVIYHLTLVVHFAKQPKRARYITPFVELSGLEQKIQETVRDFSTVIPSGASLSELLNAPVSGLAGVEQVHIPCHGLEGSISFLIHYEKQNYIKYCYRSNFWSFGKLLYTVVVDTLKIRTDDQEKDEQYMTKVEVEATFASMDSAVECVSALVDRWDKEMGKHQGKIISVDRKSMCGVMISPNKKTELKHARIITRTLWQAGALNGKGGKAIMVVPEDRNSFAKRTRMMEHTEQEKTGTTSTGAAKLNNWKKRTAADMDRDVDAEDTSMYQGT
ncbi:hypothetical protein P171DRAFT_436046 [Karstenula rhodostoma CBS 690.94]|uniref:Uncharacterized protein n=1 Tax=Karstenula rhodostoma CBS 690.94 TaxID=1392251 RepID=A0A9P4P9L4_9PLEO|nr:hypothetical protein P171DRAFT_436046 [Karstenula rhodostoma CBS 690.94]